MHQPQIDFRLGPGQISAFRGLTRDTDLSSSAFHEMEGLSPASRSSSPSQSAIRVDVEVVTRMGPLPMGQSPRRGCAHDACQARMMFFAIVRLPVPSPPRPSRLTLFGGKF